MLTHKRRNKEPHISVCHLSVLVPLKLELTNFWDYCCTWSCYWDTILHELVVYQELLEMSEKDILMYSQAKKKSFKNVLGTLFWNVPKTLNCPGFLSWLKHYKNVSFNFMFTQNIYFYNSKNDIMSSFLVTIRTPFKGYINVSILLTFFTQNIMLSEHLFLIL